MQKDTENKEFKLTLVSLMSKLVTSTDKSDKIKELQLAALQKLYRHLCFYESLGYIDKLLIAIAEKKGALILEITSKSDMNKLLKPHCPHYDGNEFVEDKYIIPEEEIICWSQASLQAPLNTTGYNRYMELCKRIFPEEYEKMINSISRKE